ncbi:MAG: SDR family oxidoreductase [Planctomycetota bacterium]|jgi:dTDP-4-dehydrorhamnose reductase
MEVEESLTPWLLTGLGGIYGWGISQVPPPRTFALAGRARPAAWPDAPGVRLDLAKAGEFAAVLEQLHPSVVIHAACLSRAQDCEDNSELAHQVNVAAVQEWLRSTSGWNSFPLYISTEQVFDGTRSSYDEESPTTPLSVYGRTKAAAEELVLAAGGAVVRLPLLLGPHLGNGRAGADGAILKAVDAGRRLSLFQDEIRTPLNPALLGPALWKIAEGRIPGVFHLAGGEAVSRLELGRRCCAQAGIRGEFDATSAADFDGPQRSLSLVLECGRAEGELGWESPNLRQSLAWNTPPAVVAEHVPQTEEA